MSVLIKPISFSEVAQTACGSFDQPVQNSGISLRY